MTYRERRKALGLTVRGNGRKYRTYPELSHLHGKERRQAREFINLPTRREASRAKSADLKANGYTLRGTIRKQKDGPTMAEVQWRKFKESDFSAEIAASVLAGAEALRKFKELGKNL